LLRAHPIGGDDANYKAIVVVFTDLSADRAGDAMDDVLRLLADSSYVDDGVVLGAFHERNEGAAIYNPSFRPFTPPVPFLLMRRAATSDPSLQPRRQQSRPRRAPSALMSQGACACSSRPSAWRSTTLTGFGSGESTSCASPTSSTPRSIRTSCFSTAVRRIRSVSACEMNRR